MSAESPRVSLRRSASHQSGASREVRTSDSVSCNVDSIDEELQPLEYPLGHATNDDAEAIASQGTLALAPLVAALDAAHTLEISERVANDWAQAHFGALGACFVFGDVAARLMPTDIQSACTTLDFAMTAAASCVWRVRFASPRSTVDEVTRQSLLVAARLCGAAVERLRPNAIRAIEHSLLRRADVEKSEPLLGESAPSRELAVVVPRLATSNAVVLLRGETGTGKTFVARLIHDGGPRAREPFQVVNCAAIPESLIESELFGHERGAFTGATKSRAGAFEAVGGGTLFLDEIGELPLASQAKLLHALEGRRFERIGSTRAIDLRARIVTATNRDLEAMVLDGTFRRDLYFRICVVSVEIPPLRTRGDDVIQLAERILADLGPLSGRRVEGFTPGAIDAIRAYAWPGNVRELRNVVERAVALGSGAFIDVSDLPAVTRGNVEPTRGQPADAGPNDVDLIRLPARLDELEGKAIDAALRATRGNRTRAAELLGIGRVTLYKKLRDKLAIP